MPSRSKTPGNHQIHAVPKKTHLAECSCLARDMMSREEGLVVYAGAAGPTARMLLALVVNTRPSLCAGIITEQRHRIWPSREPVKHPANCMIPISIWGSRLFSLLGRAAAMMRWPLGPLSPKVNSNGTRVRTLNAAATAFAVFRPLRSASLIYLATPTMHSP